MNDIINLMGTIERETKQEIGQEGINKLTTEKCLGIVRDINRELSTLDRCFDIAKHLFSFGFVCGTSTSPTIERICRLRFGDLIKRVEKTGASYEWTLHFITGGIPGAKDARYGVTVHKFGRESHPIYVVRVGIIDTQLPTIPWDQDENGSFTTMKYLIDLEFHHPSVVEEVEYDLSDEGRIVNEVCNPALCGLVESTSCSLKTYADLSGRAAYLRRLRHKLSFVRFVSQLTKAKIQRDTDTLIAEFGQIGLPMYAILNHSTAATIPEEGAQP